MSKYKPVTEDEDLKAALDEIDMLDDDFSDEEVDDWNEGLIEEEFDDDKFYEGGFDPESIF